MRRRGFRPHLLAALIVASPAAAQTMTREGYAKPRRLPRDEGFRL